MKKSEIIASAGIFAAIIIVLQIISTFVRFGPVSITLALAPIVIGAALYGRRMGLFLGFVLGVTVTVMGLFGFDGGGTLFLAEINFWATILVAILKTTLAGYAAGAVYELVSKKNSLLAVVTAGIVCPVVNTGIFVLSMFAIFNSALVIWANGANTISYAVFSLVGVNFLVELGVNLLLSAAITRVIKAIKKH